MGIVAIFGLGLVAGWYVNMLAHRVPVGASLSEPPACPNCDQPFRGLAGIPLFGWLLTRGTCRQCAAPVPVRYPMVELGTAVLFGLLAGRIGFNWALPGYLVFGMVTMILVLTDLDWKRIPNTVLFRGGGVAVALLAIGTLLNGEPERIVRGLGGGLIHFTLLFIIALISRGGMGMGDVKLVGLLGVFTAYISWATLIISILSGVLIGGLMGLVLLVAGKKGRKDEVPFGPSLTLGAWLAILWGPAISPWLFGGRQ